MQPLNPRRLKEFIREHAEAGPALGSWWVAVQGADWHSFADVRATFSAASYVNDREAGERVIFNIKGNDYRLVTYIDYERGLVVLKWFGTHVAYSRGEWKR